MVGWLVSILTLTTSSTNQQHLSDTTRRREIFQPCSDILNEMAGEFQAFWADETWCFKAKVLSQHKIEY